MPCNCNRQYSQNGTSLAPVLVHVGLLASNHIIYMYHLWSVYGTYMYCSEGYSHSGKGHLILTWHFRQCQLDQGMR